MSVSAVLKGAIQELLQDHKPHSIPEIKNYLKEEKGLAFKYDYSKGQLSGALHSLQTSGLIESYDRGQYISASGSKDNNLENAENVKAVTTAKNANFSKLYLYAKAETAQLYNKLCDSLDKIRLSDMKPTDFQDADKLLCLIQELKHFIL